ncbi:MAG: hypothetical protein ISQ08_07810 [Planctomycetes bacterium]|nr:hypothetical protein [Planctomycetota bacterium]MDA0948863.1 hypothetical protein [Planctomycetota bacterium]
MTGAQELERALEAAPTDPVDLLVLGAASAPAGLSPWTPGEGSWPAGWAEATSWRGVVDGHAVVALGSTSARPELPGWHRAFPVWWASQRGARAVLILAEGQTTGRQPFPAGVLHATDHLDLTAASPLIGLGASNRGPLFPDRTQVLDPNLVAPAERLLGSQGGVLACLPAAGMGLADAGPDALEEEADATTRSGADALAAAAHCALPALLVARLSEDALRAEDSPALLSGLLACMDTPR